jgi:ribose transport system substrate-binding protein
MKQNLTLTVAAAALAGALGAATALAEDSQSQIPTTGEKVDGAPFEAKRDWGTFKLADRIAAKVKAGEKIN